MADGPLDLLVADDGIGSLAVGYLLASRGRSVSVLDLPPPSGTTTVARASARAIVPLAALVDAAPTIVRRSAALLQPEGSIRVEQSSERLSDAGTSVAIVSRREAWTSLRDGLVSIGGIVVPGDGGLLVDDGGFVAGRRHSSGEATFARCAILGDVDVEWLTKFPADRPALPDDAIESEWMFDLAEEVVCARFGMAPGEASEWWLYGDPLDGSPGVARLRAFDATIALSLVVPLAAVVDRRVGVEVLRRRLRGHPSIASLLAESTLRSATARTVPRSDRSDVVGDGWVAGPRASVLDAVSLTAELSTAVAMTEVIDAALESPRVSSARLADLQGACREIARSSSRLPFGPIDAWGDELVRRPAGMVEGLRDIARRFDAAH